MLVSQIWYDWGKPKSDLFIKCMDSVSLFCRVNNYKYKVWTEKDCLELLEDYPQYQGMYHNVKYRIMKIDIIRYLILHQYGGVYLDCDIEPVLQSLNLDLDISIDVNTEVMQFRKGNPMILNFLDYVKTQIREKDSISIYKTWKARYVLQTTGPRSLKRFMKVNKIKKAHTYRINNPHTGGKGKVGCAWTAPPDLRLKGDEEFISYPSCSWHKMD